MESENWCCKLSLWRICWFFRPSNSFCWAIVWFKRQPFWVLIVSTCKYDLVKPYCILFWNKSNDNNYLCLDQIWFCTYHKLTKVYQGYQGFYENSWNSKKPGLFFDQCLKMGFTNQWKLFMDVTNVIWQHSKIKAASKA